MGWKAVSGTPLECAELGRLSCSFPSSEDILNSRAGIGSVWACPKCGMGWRFANAERRFERVGRNS